MRYPLKLCSQKPYKLMHIDAQVFSRKDHVKRIAHLSRVSTYNMNNSITPSVYLVHLLNYNTNPLVYYNICLSFPLYLIIIIIIIVF